MGIIVLILLIHTLGYLIHQRDLIQKVFNVLFFFDRHFKCSLQFIILRKPQSLFHNLFILYKYYVCSLVQGYFLFDGLFPWNGKLVTQPDPHLHVSLLSFQVFQNRINGDIDFYRNWEEFELGFGDIETEFWLGNCSTIIWKMIYTLCRTNELHFVI